MNRAPSGASSPPQGAAALTGLRPPMAGGGHAFGKLARAKDPRTTLVRLLTYFDDHRSRLYLVLASIVLYTLLGLAGPYLMGMALDRFIATGDRAGLLRVALWMTAAFLCNNLLQAGSSWLMAEISQRALKRLRRELFGHLQTLPMEFFDRRPAGELMSRLTNDIDAVSQALAQNVTSLLASVLSMFGILVAMFVLDRWLALASLLVVPIMLWFTRFVAVFTRKGFRELQKHLGQLNAVMEESISGQRVVSLFQRNEAAIAAFNQENERVYRAGIYANSYALLLMPLTTVLGNLFVIVLAGLGGWLALSGLVSVGIIATFINYGQNFVQPLRQLSNLYNTLQAALAGAERVFETLDTPSELDAGSTPPTRNQPGRSEPERSEPERSEPERSEPERTEPTWVTASRGQADASASGDSLLELRGDVRFSHVSFGYRPQTTVIDDMSLHALPGQMVALVGPTGAGKTTIINLLTRFYEVDRGTIEIDGRDIRTIEKSDLRRRLGLVLQDTYLFGSTVIDNIRYGRLDATDEDVVRAAEMAEADAFIRQLPDGYDTVLSERAGNLSQGQRQLLAIARTLLAKPSILILDEATSSVDTRTEAHIQKSLLRLMRGRTSFVIAHRLSTIRDADQALVMKAGRIVEAGTHQELLERKGFYHHLYSIQFKGHEL